MTERQLMGINLSLVEQGLSAMAGWERNWPALTPDETLALAPERASEIIASLVSRLEENYPFFNPVYAGQMLKPAHAIATTAYFLTQQVNPNNHALDGGPATAGLERETIASLATMVGFDPATTLGHLTSSGTIANLEALWVSRQLHPDKAIAFSSEAHYTHGRMCEVIGVRGVKIATTAEGRMDLADLRAKLETENIGTVVATTGTTSLGAVDAVDEILDLAAEFGVRIHVDAAFGGFFSLLAQLPDSDNASLGAKTAAAFNSISRCDSVVIDPHKHALQPYGCGSVLFKDASVGRFYKHDSPYTYFTSAELHLGEISLECSRAGAAAAAFWATLQAFPLETDTGLGPILKKCRQAAVLFASLIEDSNDLSLVLQPGLDIVVYYPTASDRRASSISALSHAVFEAGMVEGPEAFFLAKVHLSPDRFAGSEEIIWDQPTVVGLRSVLMKPEHLAAAPGLYERITRAVRAARDCQSTG